jgi:hypothetical protein
MTQDRRDLLTQLKQRLVWIASASGVVAVLAVAVLLATGPVTVHLVLAVLFGTFITMFLGGGLFSVSFYSERSGFDSEAALYTIQSPRVLDTDSATPSRPKGGD